jgi:hypothetical protein
MKKRRVAALQTLDEGESKAEAAAEAAEHFYKNENFLKK